MPAAASLHIQADAHDPVRVVDLTVGSVRIGRGSLCDVRLPAADCADEECRLRRRGDVWQLVPSRATTGVSLDGRAVTGATTLVPGATFQIRGLSLTLRVAVADADVPASARWEAPATPPVEPPRSATAETGGTARSELSLSTGDRDRWLQTHQATKRFEARFRAASEQLHAAADARPASRVPDPRPPAAPRVAVSPSARDREPPVVAPARSLRPSPSVPRRDDLTRPTTAPTPPPAPRARSVVPPTPPSVLPAAPKEPPRRAEWSRPASASLAPAVPRTQPPVRDRPRVTTPPPSIARVVPPVIAPVPAPPPPRETPATAAPESAPPPLETSAAIEVAPSIGEFVEPVGEPAAAYAAPPIVLPPHDPPERASAGFTLLDRDDVDLDDDDDCDVDAPIVRKLGAARQLVSAPRPLCQETLERSFELPESEPVHMAPFRVDPALLELLERAFDVPVAEPELIVPSAVESIDVRPMAAEPVAPAPMPEPEPEPEVAPLPEPMAAEVVAPAARPAPIPSAPRADAGWSYQSPFVTDTNRVAPRSRPTIAAERRGDDSLREESEAPTERALPGLDGPRLSPRDWPTVSDILAARGRGTTLNDPTGRPAPSPSILLQAPTVAAEPRQWQLPLWLAWLPAASASLAAAVVGVGLSWIWATDGYNAGLVARRLAANERNERPLPEEVNPGGGRWWETTAPHLVQWAAYLDKVADDPARALMAREVLFRARQASPLNPTVRHAIARGLPDDSATPPEKLATSLGQSRDVLTLSWAGRQLLEAGHKDAALLAYRTALEMAAEVDPARPDPPVFLEGEQPRRYAVPTEERLAVVLREMAAAPQWTYAEWSSAIPHRTAAPLAAARVLRELANSAAATALDVAVADAEAEPIPAPLQPTAESDEALVTFRAAPAPADAVRLAAGAAALAMKQHWAEARDRYRRAIDRAGDDSVRRACWVNVSDLSLRLDEESGRRLALDAAKNADPKDEITRRAVELQKDSGFVAQRMPGRAAGQPAGPAR